MLENYINSEQKRNSRILIVTTDVKFYLKIEKLLQYKYTITLSKSYNDALSKMSLKVFDLIIIHNLFELTLSIADKTILPLNIDFLFKTFREHIHYNLSIILLFDNEISKAKAREFELKEVKDSLALPINELTLIKCIDKVILSNKKESISSLPQNIIIPKFIGIGLVISTGGPKTIYDVISKIPDDFEPPIFIVQHGPNWLLDDYVEKFYNRYRKSTIIAKNGQIIQPNTIYIAPDKFHTVIDKYDFTLRLLDTEKECFVKPSADPLFRSIARAFGQFSIGVVMTGLGSDGTKGSLHIEAAGGTIFTEDPKTAIAPSMPTSLIKSGCNVTILKSDMICEAIIKSATKITNNLKSRKK
jgi:two-component system chemotaxis response regulator CheB